MHSEAVLQYHHVVITCTVQSVQYLTHSMCIPRRSILSSLELSGKAIKMGH
jgi:hypothetical protein